MSKVFRAINRFSEDVDVTLDYRGLDTSFDPFTEGVSRNQLKKFSFGLKSFVQDHTHNVVAPHFEKILAAEFGADGYRLELSADGELLRVHYPTALEVTGNYMANSVLIEFGGRNITEPNEVHEVSPDIAGLVPDLVFPRSRVSVLSPERTFWEKATLMHVESQRGMFRPNAERLSRHWYDLSMLADMDIGQAALENIHLLIDVVNHKKVFYNTSYANYDACLTGQLCLLPDDALLLPLAEDFQNMIKAGMFIGLPPDFDKVIGRLRVLEADINRLR